MSRKRSYRRSANEKRLDCCRIIKRIRGEQICDHLLFEQRSELFNYGCKFHRKKKPQQKKIEGRILWRKVFYCDNKNNKDCKRKVIAECLNKNFESDISYYFTECEEPARCPNKIVIPFPFPSNQNESMEDVRSKLERNLTGRKRQKPDNSRIPSRDEINYIFPCSGSMDGNYYCDILFSITESTALTNLLFGNARELRGGGMFEFKYGDNVALLDYIRASEEMLRKDNVPENIFQNSQFVAHIVVPRSEVEGLVDVRCSGSQLKVNITKEDGFEYTNNNMNNKVKVDPNVKFFGFYDSSLIDELNPYNLCDDDIFDISAVDEEDLNIFGHNILFYLAAQGHLKELQFLVGDRGFRVNSTDMFGNTPLEVAKLFERGNIVDYLSTTKSSVFNDEVPGTSNEMLEDTSTEEEDEGESSEEEPSPESNEYGQNDFISEVGEIKKQGVTNGSIILLLICVFIIFLALFVGWIIKNQSLNYGYRITVSNATSIIVKIDSELSFFESKLAETLVVGSRTLKEPVVGLGFQPGAFGLIKKMEKVERVLRVGKRYPHETASENFKSSLLSKGSGVLLFMGKDGSGKSTLIDILCDDISKDGYQWCIGSSGIVLLEQSSSDEHAIAKILKVLVSEGSVRIKGVVNVFECTNLRRTTLPHFLMERSDETNNILVFNKCVLEDCQLCKKEYRDHKKSYGDRYGSKHTPIFVNRICDSFSPDCIDRESLRTSFSSIDKEFDFSDTKKGDRKTQPNFLERDKSKELCKNELKMATQRIANVKVKVQNIKKTAENRDEKWGVLSDLLMKLNKEVENDIKEVKSVIKTLKC